MLQTFCSLQFLVVILFFSSLHLYVISGRVDFVSSR